MFVKVKHLPGCYEFTLVDIDQGAGNAEQVTVLTIGTVVEEHLSSFQAWYAIADNLVNADLDIDIKRGAARDLAEWLPPLTRDILIDQRRQDLADLAGIGSVVSQNELDGSIRLNDDDPLTIVAGWLEQ